MDTGIIDLPDESAEKKSSPSRGVAYTPPRRIESGHGGEPLPASSVTVDPSDRFNPSTVDVEPVGVAPKRRRPLLLATAAIIIGAAIGAGYMISPYNTLYPINVARLQANGNALVTSVQQRASALVAPAAKIAQTETSEVGAPVKSTIVLPTRSEQQAEIQALHGGNRSGSSKPTVVAETGHSEANVKPTEVVRAPNPVPRVPVMQQPTSGASTGIVVFETGSASPSRPTFAESTMSVAAKPTEASVSALSAQVEAVQAKPEPVSTGSQPLTVTKPSPVAPVEPGTGSQANTVSASLTTEAKPVVEAPKRAEKPTDPVAVVALLQAAPMSAPEQIEVLNEVARLAIIVRDIRAENVALKAKVQSTSDRVDVAVADFTRRLSLSEAHGSIDAAMSDASATSSSAQSRAGGQPGYGGGSAGGLRGAPSATRIVNPSIVAPGPAAQVRYRVTAASPGMAMLALIDRSGGDGAQIQVAVGDQVPGYGRITAIQQRGAAWVVQTDKGPDKGVIQ